MKSEPKIIRQLRKQTDRPLTWRKGGKHYVVKTKGVYVGVLPFGRPCESPIARRRTENLVHAIERQWQTKH